MWFCYLHSVDSLIDGSIDGHACSIVLDTVASIFGGNGRNKKLVTWQKSEIWIDPQKETFSEGKVALLKNFR